MAIAPKARLGRTGPIEHVSGLRFNINQKLFSREDSLHLHQPHEGLVVLERNADRSRALVANIVTLNAVQ
jgi:hypothetical protein